RAPFAWRTPVHPDPLGTTDETVLRNELHSFEAAVSAVVAIVAHHEVMPFRHLVGSAAAQRPSREEQLMHRIAETLLGEDQPGILGIRTGHLERNFLAVDRQLLTAL